MAHCRTNKSKLIKKAFRRGIIDSVCENLCQPTLNEMSEIEDLIHNTFPEVEIQRVKRIQNGFLKAMYLLKKAEYKSCYDDVEEKILFHVTSANNAKAITKNNFDWRQVSRGKFGLGTSFANNARYANTYANDNIGEERVIIVTKVLVSKVTKGRYGLKVPPGDYDTTFGNKKVYVKFSDNEFLPIYVAYYYDDEYY